LAAVYFYMLKSVITLIEDIYVFRHVVDVGRIELEYRKLASVARQVFG
jgi:hypothetical protein